MKRSAVVRISVQSRPPAAGHNLLFAKALRHWKGFWSGRVRRVYGTSVPRFAAYIDAQKDCE